MKTRGVHEHEDDLGARQLLRARATVRQAKPWLLGQEARMPP